MIRRTSSLATLAVFIGALLPASSAQAAPATPAWKLNLVPIPANFAPGSTSTYLLTATNVGAAPSDGTPITFTATFPAGLTPIAATGAEGHSLNCEISTPIVTCATSEVITPGRLIKVDLKVEVAAAPPAETLVTEASIAGGGATAATTTAPTKISADPLAFDFLPGDAGFSARLGEPDGSAAALAASHPYQLTVDVGFPTEEPPGGLTGAGHFRDVLTDLPPGLIGDPTATPVLCTEAELVTSDEPGCPEASQVGTATVTTTLGSGTTPIFTGNLYNMVPPPGSPAELAFEAVDSGIYVHLLASVRSDGDYGITTATNDILALGGNPLFNVQAQIWGDPSSSAHDHIRGNMQVQRRLLPGLPAKDRLPHPAGRLPRRGADPDRPRRQLGGTGPLSPAQLRQRRPRRQPRPALGLQPALLRTDALRPAEHESRRLPLGPRRRPAPAPGHRQRSARHRRAQRRRRHPARRDGRQPLPGRRPGRLLAGPDRLPRRRPLLPRAPPPARTPQSSARSKSPPRCSPDTSPAAPNPSSTPKPGCRSRGPCRPPGKG